MANIGISFGSATGGTGFDVTSTVASIMAAQRTPETAWQARTAALGKQDAVLTTLGSDLSAFSTALSSLTSFDGVFASKQGGVSDTSVLALTGTATNAVAGTHTVTVQQLAQTSSQYSNAFSPTASLSGTLTIQVGNGSAASLTLNNSDNTIAGLASAINSASLGVSASVISDRSGSRLSIVSNTGGAAGQVTLGGSVNDSGGSALTFTPSQTGQDAEYKLDGIALTSPANTVTDALQGVQFQLLAASANPVTLQVANDTASIRSALSNLVSGYNALTTAVSAQEGKDSTGAAQPLFGNPVIATLQQQLSSAFANVSGGGGTNLAQLGISFNPNGQLSLDTNALQSTLNTNFAAAASFFQASSDFGQHLASTLNALGSPSTGALTLASKQNSDEEGSIAKDTSALEARLVTYQSTLTAQLNTANHILQGIPQQLSEIDQIYAAITGYNAGRNGG